MSEAKILRVMSYGDQQGNDKGLIEFTFLEDGTIQKHCYTVDGKANHAIVKQDSLLIPVKEAQGNYLYLYEHQTLVEKLPVQYFYSHGFMLDTHTYCLASYEDGVDALYDMKQKQERVILHHREQCEQKAKSHYIAATPDQQYVYGIENGLNQIYIYEVVEGQLQVHDTFAFPITDGIRLMPYSRYSHCAYLNTEKSNRIYTLRYKQGHFTIQNQIELQPTIAHSFCGGLAISEDGMRLAVTMRMENKLSLFAIGSDGELSLLAITTCGNMPRDVCFFHGEIAVSCTLDHAIELYAIENTDLIKTKSIPIAQPITFV